MSYYDSFLGSTSGQSGLLSAFNPGNLGASVGSGLLSAGAGLGLGAVSNFLSRGARKRAQRQRDALVQTQLRYIDDGAQAGRGEVNRALDITKGDINSGLADRGLYNTTVRDSLTTGANAEAGRSLAQIASDVGRQKADVYNGLSVEPVDTGSFAKYAQLLGASLFSNPGRGAPGGQVVGQPNGYISSLGPAATEMANPLLQPNSAYQSSVMGNNAALLGLAPPRQAPRGFGVGPAQAPTYGGGGGGSGPLPYLYGQPKRKASRMPFMYSA